jgi:hypothetical protein
MILEGVNFGVLSQMISLVANPLLPSMAGNKAFANLCLLLIGKGVEIYLIRYVIVEINNFRQSAAGSGADSEDS